jgi:phage-related protein
MQEYNEQLEGTTGLTQDYADEANKQYTLMDKLKQKWSELTLKASAFLEPLEPILSGMTALGPLMIALSTSAGTGAVKWALQTAALIAHKAALIASTIAIKAVTVAQWLWNVAMTANPIGLIVAAIAALIAAGVLLWKNWDKVVAFFKAAWRTMSEVMEKAKQFFINIWNSIVGVFKQHWDKILAILFPVVGIPVLIARHWTQIKEFFVELWTNITAFLKNAWNGIVDFFKAIPARIGEAFSAIKDMILAPFRAAWSGIESGINWLIRALNSIKVKIPSWVPLIGGKEFGINIKEVSLPKFAQGTMITEPTLLSSLRTGKPMGIAGEAGAERLQGVTETRGQSGASITNNFNGPWFIREEADIQKIARELYRLQQGKARAIGSLLP